MRSIEPEVLQAMKESPVTLLLGPRQCGKTTLARQIFARQGSGASYFDLENPVDLARLDNPMLALGPLHGLIVIDEVQRKPDLFPVLRVLSDRTDVSARFLILGSSSRDLLMQSSESLTGRIATIELTPFNSAEAQDLNGLWLRGGFPRSYLAPSEGASFRWRNHYIQSVVEGDLPALGIEMPPLQLRRFWAMLAHTHGQVLNLSDLGRSLGINHTTVRRYVDLLAGTFLLRELKPWHANLGKRQVKTPKTYIRDSGLFHALLNVPSHSALLQNPKLGASWEGFALEEIIRAAGASQEESTFWATHGEAELDLYLPFHHARRGYEFKYSDAPSRTRSMASAFEALALNELWVIYPGSVPYRIDERIEVVPLPQACARLRAEPVR